MPSRTILVIKMSLCIVNYAIEKDFSEWRDWELNELKILVHVLFLRRNMKNLMDEMEWTHTNGITEIIITQEFFRKWEIDTLICLDISFSSWYVSKAVPATFKASLFMSPFVPCSSISQTIWFPFPPAPVLEDMLQLDDFPPALPTCWPPNLCLFPTCPYPPRKSTRCNFDTYIHAINIGQDKFLKLQHK